MATVACVLRSGGDYTPEYVRRLRDSVAEHLPGVRFVCLSDVDVPCERIPLITKWPGWLAKLELFRPGLFQGTVIYLDLDTIPVGSLKEIADHAHRFTMLSDFYRMERPASGVMAWNGDYSHIYYRFDASHVAAYRTFRPHGGDCGWIRQNLGFPPDRLQALFPGQVVSYKADVRGKGIPPNARLVCFHGKPRPHQVGWKL